MDFLNRLYAQVRDLFLSMTPGNRITVGLLAVLLVVSLGFLIGGVTKSEGEFTPLYNGRYFSQAEQRAVDDALGKAGLSQHSWEGMRLMVPKSAWAKYAAAIAENKAIVDMGGYLDRTINNLGAYESGKMMDTKKLVGMQQELSAALSDFRGIEKAQVLVSERSEMDPKMYQRKIMRSAAVSVWPLGGEPLDPEKISAISTNVGSSLGITDLKEITITDMKNGLSWIGNNLKAKGGNKTYEDAQKEYEASWEQKIRELFPDITKMQVKTTVELDKTLWRDEHDITHGKPTTVATKERTTDLQKKDRDIAGRPGLVPQLGLPVPNPAAQVISGGSTTEKTEESEVQKALTGVEGQGRFAGLTPKTVTASIRIPMSYIRKAWALANAKPGETAPESTPEELASTRLQVIEMVRTSVGNLIVAEYRPRDAQDTAQMVNVSTYDDPAPIVETSPSFAQLLMLWLGSNWETLSLLGLVLVGLCVLWAMTRVKQTEPIVIYEAAELPTEAEQIAEGEEEEEEAGEINRSLEPFNRSMRSLQNEVADLVTENPDAAASVLRQWIGNLALQD